MDLFEGYIGIQIGEYQLVKDVIFGFLLFLFLVFALIFHSHFRQFFRMMKNVAQIKQRQSLFEITLGNIKERQQLFHLFMIFQALFLISLFLYYSGITFFSLPIGSIETILKSIGLSFSVVILFYLLKQGLYLLFAWTFAIPDQTRLWGTSYIATIELWGVLLYPLLILSFFSNIQPRVCLFLFLILYILCRFVIFYKSIRIFQIKKDRLLFFFLYLCAQEIMPLFLTFKGIEYLYNFIEVSTLWR